MAKRSAPRSDSVAGAATAMAAALAAPLLPPAHIRLRAGDKPFWDGIILARARDKWDAHDMALAAQLARTMADIEQLTEELDREGHVIENFRGTPIANPKHSVIETLVRRATSLSRVVHVHANAKDGDSRDQGKKAKKQKDAAAAMDEADDDLIRRPAAHH